MPKFQDDLIRDATPDPEAWPACSVCATAYTLIRALPASGGWRWVWVRDCKCRASRPMLVRRGEGS